MGVKNIEANIDKKTASYSIVNTIKGKYLKALISVNKGKNYNSNILKDKGNRTKRLAL